MKIGFIGCGNMAKALIIGGIKSFDAQNIYVTNRTLEKAEVFAKEHNLNVCKSNTELVTTCDIIFISVKPQMYDNVLEEISEYLAGKTAVSIAAGITLDYLYKKVDSDCVFVRAMPNTPAQVGLGTTGITFDAKISDTNKEVITKFFESAGTLVEVLENQMDLVIGASGSSPAYAYMFIDAIAKATSKLGLDYEDALKLSASAVMGAAKMVLDTKISPEILTKNVCSPGGTTIEGVAVLENDLDELMFKTVDAVVEKSKKLTK